MSGGIPTTSIAFCNVQIILIIMLLTQHAHRFFHLGVHVPFYLHFWGYKENELHFLHARSCTMLFFCKYYAVDKNFFFCLTLGQTGSGVLSDPWPLCLSHHFLVILYITCQILFFYTELNARLPIYSHDH